MVKLETILDKNVEIYPELLEIPKVTRLCDRIEGLDKSRQDVGDCKLYVETEGDGDPIVLLHGGPGSTHHYFHPHFSELAKSSKVVYYDQRGCGLSDRIKGERYSLKQAAEDLENIKLSLGFDRWHVLGHSYGGLLAQYYTTKFPESVNGLILSNSSLGFPRVLFGNKTEEFISKEERERIKEVQKTEGLSVAQRIFNAFMNGDWKRQNFHKPTEEEIAYSALYEWDHDNEFRSSICKEVNMVDLEGAFDECPIPTLIIESEYDLTWPDKKRVHMYNNHPGSEMVVFKEAGHSPFVDQPEEYFCIVQKFIGSSKGSCPEEISKYKEYVKEWEKREPSLNNLCMNMSLTEEWYNKVTERYSIEELERIDEPLNFSKVGFALFEKKKYNEALEVFNRGEKYEDDIFKTRPLSLIWQGHILDLLGRREEAVEKYKQVKDMNLGNFVTHSNYGIKLSSDYAAEKMERPFSLGDISYKS